MKTRGELQEQMTKTKGRQPGMDHSMPSTERETTAARLIILMGMPGLEVRECEGCLLVICWLVTLIIGWCRRCFVTPEQWVLYLHFPCLKNETLITAWKLLPHKLHPNISIISLRLFETWLLSTKFQTVTLLLPFFVLFFFF